MNTNENSVSAFMIGARQARDVPAHVSDSLMRECLRSGIVSLCGHQVHFTIGTTEPLDNNAKTTATADFFELPLFYQYKMEVEFDRRREWTSDLATKLSHSAAGDTELAEEIRSYGEITPLELLWEGAGLHAEFAINPETGQNMLKCCTASISYVGDDELWQLNPRLSDFPIGELFRRRLILSELGSDFGSVLKYLGSRIDHIQGILAHQAAKIDAFHRELPCFVRSQVELSRSR